MKSLNFLVRRLAEKPAKRMPSKLYCELKLMFGDFNEVAQPKTSLAKYSIESNDVAVQRI